MSLKKLIRPIAERFGKSFPVSMMRLRYFIRFHKFLNLRNPHTLNEKILYLCLKTDTSKWTELTDKYLVRNYVKECGYDKNLIPLLGVWNDAAEIDFDRLPKSFVLKTNHGCGDVKIIKDKDKIDKNDIVVYFNSLLKKRYGALEGGIHYQRIEPKVICEQLLENDDYSKKYSSSIIDYKLWCFNGKCKYIFVISNRTRTGVDVMLYDENWKECPEFVRFSSHHRKGVIMPCPSNIEEIIKIGETLARPFPVVRVDLYSIGDKIYFGEMTFTSYGGLMNYFTDEFQKKTGEMINEF